MSLLELRQYFFPKKCANLSAVTVAYSSFVFSLKYYRIIVGFVATNLHYGHLVTHGCMATSEFISLKEYAHYACMYV